MSSRIGPIRQARRLVRRELQSRHLPLYWWAKELRGGHLEPEIALVQFFCSDRGVAVDVGAHYGRVLRHLRSHSARSVAFEPIPELARALRAGFGGKPDVEVHEVALSDAPGRAVLRVPRSRPALSTIQSTNEIEKRQNVTGTIERLDVAVRTLDSFELADVTFLKIDVEGHELAVLRGAKATLERSQPAILLEAEEGSEPTALADITAFLGALSYEGHFLFGGVLHPLDSLDPQVHQNRANSGTRDRYVRDFFFVPPRRAAELARARRALAATQS